MVRPITTLFLLMSLDGKISTGSTDNMDVDKDLPLIAGVREGLHQYYDIEQTTDLWSFNSGRVLAKVGINIKDPVNKSPVSFAIVDNTHLTKRGLLYLSASYENIVIITSNKNHPAITEKYENIFVIFQNMLNLPHALSTLRTVYGCDRLTIQTGGTLNSIFLREKLIDYVDIVIAPILIGGKNTSTLVDGNSLTSKADLQKIGVLELKNLQALKNSYIRITYKVIR